MKQVHFKDGKTAPVNNIYCIGRNYAEHISELGNVPTGEPVVFLKPTTALNTNNTMRLPEFSDDIHHEVELVLYIGRDIADDDTPNLDCIAGFGIGLDLTARDIQSQLKAKGLPWTLAKGFPDAAWLSVLQAGTPPQISQLSLTVNGEQRQHDNTGSMLFDIEFLLRFLHSRFRLRQGDLIYTGTPKGVGRLHKGDALITTLNNDSYTLQVI